GDTDLAMLDPLIGDGAEATCLRTAELRAGSYAQAFPTLKATFENAILSITDQRPVNVHSET
ncbi:MAG: hypothetical protein ACREVB_01700, partial [Burkholderiales bacterium]